MIRKKPGAPRSPQRPPDSAQLAKILADCGLELSAAQINLLWKYHQLLREHNPEQNLTRIHNFFNMVIKLYVDSILPGGLMELPSPLLDLGTGAGMPGIPLKIAFPHIEVILAESRKKRVEFLETVLGALNLKNVRVAAETIGAQSEIPVNGVITRAVESITETLGRIGGCLSRGGLAIFMKGPHCGEEVRDAISRMGGRFRLTRDDHYRIPHTPHERRLVVFERVDAPPWARKAEFMDRRQLRIIESENNETFRDLKKLLTSRGVRKLGQALVSGPKQIAEILGHHPERCIAWIGRYDREPPPESAPAHLGWYQLAPALFDPLDLFGTGPPLLLINTGRIDKWDPAAPLPPGCTLFIPFQDPENVGAVLRSAAAFGVAQAVLLSESAHPFHPKAVRASGGAVLKVKLLEGPSIGAIPPETPLVALSPEGQDMAGFQFPESFGLLPGLEGPGLPEHFRKNAVSIPISPEVESLNGAVAVSIALYAWSKSLR
jgi:16S rRNA (guanine(527)-N(7))-methyltransferase RsmG